MKKYFIIRANGCCLCWIKGTMKELESFLSSIGSKIVRTDSVYEEDFHLVYRKRIITETDAIGYDDEMYSKLKKQIADLLSGVNAKAYFLHRGSVEMALHDVCRDLPIKTDRIDILVSDGEEYKLPKNHFCSYRDFHKFSDIDIKDFRTAVRDVAYVQLAK